MALVALLFAACETTNPDTSKEGLTPEITVTPSGIVTMPAAGGDVELAYRVINPTEGVQLEATTTDEWITNIAVEAERLTFSVERNHSEQQRVGMVTLCYTGAEELTIAIQQNEALAAGDVRLSITSERKTIFEAVGGTGEVAYMLECDEADAMPEVVSDVEWITIDEITSKSISYTVARNPVEQKRTGHITLSFSGKSAEATIEQKAAEFLPILSVSSTMVRCGETVTFSVEYADEDVTAEATIHDYYTNEAIANPFTTTETSERVFYAKYNNRRSKVLTINIIPEYTPELPEDPQPESFAFNQRMLIVDHTGVGCGYCPNMKSTLKNLENDANYGHKFNIVYAYSFSGNEVCYSSAASTFWNYYKNVCSTNNVGMYLTGYPSATLNYCVNYAASPGTVQAQIDKHWVEDASASIALAAVIKDGKIVINTEVKSSVAQNIHLAVWLLEDDIYAVQSGAGSNTWMNTHHSVLRDCPTGASSSDISGIDYGYVTANSTLQRVCELDLYKATAWVESNFKLIAVISAPNGDYDNRYEVLDTAICEINGSVVHDYKE